MATGTLSPSPKFYAWNVTTGLPLAGGLVYTVTAGGSYPGNAVSTYTDVGLSVANTNPIVLNSAGYAVIFLTPGVSYKFLVYDSNSVLQWSQDNINSVPVASSGVDVVSGIAGENLALENVVYLSDGSGSKNAGQWYKADTTNTYSSTTPEIGIVVAAASATASVTVRIDGQMTISGSSLTPGAIYYVGTAGAMTATLPGSNARIVGQSLTSGLMVFRPFTVLPNTDNGINDFRLTLTTGVPVTVTDVTGAVTIFCTPYKGNRISLYDSSGNATVLTSAQFSIAVPATTSQMYDIFCYNNAGVATLELLAWTNDTSRATAIVLTTTGSYTKSGDLTRRYLGSFRTTGVSGQTEDSGVKRYLWNNYNRVSRMMRRVESTVSWTYTLLAWRQVNAATANQLDIVNGLQENAIDVWALSAFSNTAASAAAYGGTSIGEDSTTTPATGSLYNVTSSTISGAIMTPSTSLRTFPAVGRHFYAWLESANATGTATWTGTNNGQSGINAIWVS